MNTIEYMLWLKVGRNYTVSRGEKITYDTNHQVIQTGNERNCRVEELGQGKASNNIYKVMDNLYYQIETGSIPKIYFL